MESDMRKGLAAGNWKMNGTGAELAELAAIAEFATPEGPQVLICPPATLISRMAAVAGAVAVGGQDCHAKVSGAHTGDISARMLKEAGASYVILGHSERRQDHAETDAIVRAKAEAALAEGLTIIVCVGETKEQRESGETISVVGRQLSGSVPDLAEGQRLVIAYEPVWAIGTGLVPTLEQIGEVHSFIRAELIARFGAEIGGGVQILYGGSVKSSNAAEIFAVADVDGALVGGASLKAADFGPIIKALAAR